MNLILKKSFPSYFGDFFQIKKNKMILFFIFSRKKNDERDR